MPEDQLPIRELPEYFFQNMEVLADNTTGFFRETRANAVIDKSIDVEEQKRINNLSEPAKKILPFALSLSQVETNSRENAGIALISAQDVDPFFLRRTLQN